MFGGSCAVSYFRGMAGFFDRREDNFLASADVLSHGAFCRVRVVFCESIDQGGVGFHQRNMPCYLIDSHEQADAHDALISLDKFGHADKADDCQMEFHFALPHGH